MECNNFEWEELKMAIDTFEIFLSKVIFIQKLYQV